MYSFHRLCGLPTEFSKLRMTKGKFIFFVDVTNVNECQLSFDLISENEDIHLINQFCACVFAASPVRIC